MKATDVLTRSELSDADWSLARILAQSSEPSDADSWIVRFEWWRHPTLLGLERDDPEAVQVYRCHVCRRSIAAVFRAGPAVRVLVTIRTSRPTSIGSHPDLRWPLSKTMDAYLLASNRMTKIEITTKVTQQHTGVVDGLGCRCLGRVHLTTRDVYRNLAGGRKSVEVHLPPTSVVI